MLKRGERTQGRAMKYTFYWLDGYRFVLEGDDGIDALKQGGYDGGALKYIDFYLRGDNTNYVWIDDEWVPKEKVSGLDQELAGILQEEDKNLKDTDKQMNDL